jgi:hypothetical protein
MNPTQAGTSVPALDPSMLDPNCEAAGAAAPAPARTGTIERGPSLTGAAPTNATALAKPAPRQRGRKPTAVTAQIELPGTSAAAAAVSNEPPVNPAMPEPPTAAVTPTPRRPRKPRQPKQAPQSIAATGAKTRFQLRIIHNAPTGRVNFSRSAAVGGVGEEALRRIVSRIDLWLEKFGKDLGVEIPKD